MADARPALFSSSPRGDWSTAEVLAARWAISSASIESARRDCVRTYPAGTAERTACGQPGNILLGSTRLSPVAADALLKPAHRMTSDLRTAPILLKRRRAHDSAKRRCWTNQRD
jgi:hypothetical protein